MSRQQLQAVSHLSLSQLKELSKQLPPADLKKFLSLLAADTRAGAQQLAKQIRWRLEWEAQERKRLKKLTQLERQLKREGFKLIAGVDEAGRGCLAGPIVAAAVILPDDVYIYRLNDSKLLTPLIRQSLAEEIKAKAVCWCVAEVAADEIDQLGITAANKLVLEKAVSGLKLIPDAVLADYFQLDIACQCWPLTKGDQKSQSIAAAAVLAKVYRDSLMQELDALFPGYGFKEHKGYATPAHLKALAALGPAKVHRQTFLTNLSQASLF